MNRARVLLADDHKEMRDSVRRHLEDEFDVLETVENGRVLLEAASRLQPDICVLDISMPDMTGWDVARKVRQLCGQERPLLIAISGVYKQAADQILGKLAGFNYYLAKPYDPSVLTALLRDAQ